MSARAAKGWHSLSEVDDETGTAICSICGPTRFRPPTKSRTGRRCFGAHRDSRLRTYTRRDGRGRSPGERTAQVARQGGVCAACGGPPAEGQGLHDDHDHETGEWREMLCRGCNLALGHVGDSPARLRGLIAYLARHGRQESHPPRTTP